MQSRCRSFLNGTQLSNATVVPGTQAKMGRAKKVEEVLLLLTMQTLAAACLALFLTCSSAAYCDWSPNPNAQPNLNPVNFEAPQLVRTTANGKAYTAGTPGNEFWLLHVYGSPYEMGFAHGTLMAEEVRNMTQSIWAYLEGQVEEYMQGLPNWLSQDIADFGLDVALDQTIEYTKNFTGSYFIQEMQGLADGSGADFQRIYRIHLLAELTRSQCSMIGAWGVATQSTGKMLQLRALDWDVHGPFKDFPAVVVYHPSGNNSGHPFVNVGFVGWIASLTGISSVQLAISHIGVEYGDSSFGNESRIGIPWMFLLRDILQFDHTYQDSIARIQSANRTCDLILGVGDGKAQTFRAFQYSYSVANVISDTNLIPANNTWHPKIPNTVYFAMDWNCPQFDSVMARLLQKYHGNITSENIIQNIAPIVQTGNLHVAMYDLTSQVMFVTFAAKDGSPPPLMGYDRQYTFLNVTALVNEPLVVVPPSTSEVPQPVFEE